VRLYFTVELREERFACAQADCQDCLNAWLREHEKLVHFVIGRQLIGQAKWAEFHSQSQQVIAWILPCVLAILRVICLTPAPNRSKLNEIAPASPGAISLQVLHLTITLWSECFFMPQHLC